MHQICFDTSLLLTPWYHTNRWHHTLFIGVWVVPTETSSLSWAGHVPPFLRWVVEFTEFDIDQAKTGWERLWISYLHLAGLKQILPGRTPRSLVPQFTKKLYIYIYHIKTCNLHLPTGKKKWLMIFLQDTNPGHKWQTLEEVNPVRRAMHFRNHGQSPFTPTKAARKTDCFPLAAWWLSDPKTSIDFLPLFWLEVWNSSEVKATICFINNSG